MYIRPNHKILGGGGGGGGGGGNGGGDKGTPNGFLPKGALPPVPHPDDFLPKGALPPVPYPPVAPPKTVVPLPVDIRAIVAPESVLEDKISPIDMIYPPLPGPFVPYDFE